MNGINSVYDAVAERLNLTFLGIVWKYNSKHENEDTENPIYYDEELLMTFIVCYRNPSPSWSIASENQLMNNTSCHEMGLHGIPLTDKNHYHWNIKE